MGCSSGKPHHHHKAEKEFEQLMPYTPLFELKRNLLEELNMSDNHFFSSFVTLRFHNSLRRNPEIKINIDRVR